MEPQLVRERVSAFCARTIGPGALDQFERLSGGANMESWLLRWAGEDYVLRRMPDGLASAEREEGVTAISLADQAQLIRLARDGGVSAPVVPGELAVADGLGEGFLMERARGETLPHKILDAPAMQDAAARLSEQCAGELAAIHALPVAAAPASLIVTTPADLLAEQAATYDRLGGAIAIYDYALGWLERHCPEPAEPALLHGDFRMGNLVVDESGITAVLDWELAHVGDPLEDLAYLCTPSWRFGHWRQEAGGFASRDAFLSAYEAATGRMVDRARFDWWLVYNTLWWGICCLRMGHSWRDGTMPTLERPIIGRRVSEVEIDLLLLFESMGEGGGGPIEWAEPPLLPETGESAYAELLGALRIREKDRLAGTSGHARFDALMAVNALGMAQREAAWSALFASRQRERFERLGTTEHGLRARLRSGQIALGDDDLWDHLRFSALERLSIDQPKYAGLAEAKERWL